MKEGGGTRGKGWMEGLREGKGAGEGEKGWMEGLREGKGGGEGQEIWVNINRKVFEWIVIKYAKSNIKMRQTYVKSIWNLINEFNLMITFWWIYIKKNVLV